MSVVAANSWMNTPNGITVANGRVVSVDVWRVFFNDAFWYEAVHMLLAAYVVAGFTVAGVYAYGMLRGRRDRYHRVGLVLALTVGAVAIPAQIVVGDIITRYVFHAEPAKFSAIEGVATTATHVPEVLGGFMINGKLRYGIPIPDGASLLSGFSPNTRITGLNAVPAAVRPQDGLVAIVHLAFDVMVGGAFLLLALVLWFGLEWRRHRLTAPSGWFLRATSVSGLVAVVCLECGWVVTEVGRQPWTVVGLLLTRDAVQTSGNVWPFFAGAVVVYAAVTVGAVYALRALRRGWAAGEDIPSPYGPDVFGAGDDQMTRLVACVLLFAVVAYGVFAGADFGTGLWDLTAGGARRGRAARSLIDHAIAPVWEANHTWLVFCLVLMWSAFPSAFTAISTTQYLPLGVAAIGIVLRGSGFAFRKVSMRTAEQRANGAAFAASSVITPFCFGAIAGGIASGRVPADGHGDPVESWLNPTSIVGGVLAVLTCGYLAASSNAEADRLGDIDLQAWTRDRVIVSAAGAGAAAICDVFVLDADAHRLYTRLLEVGWPLVALSAVCGTAALVLVLFRRSQVRPVLRPLGAVAVGCILIGWAVASTPTCSERTRRSSRPPHRLSPWMRSWPSPPRPCCSLCRH